MLFGQTQVDDLDFSKVEQDESHLAKALPDWPSWVQMGLGYVKKALAVIGITVDFDNIPNPAQYLDELITLVQSSTSTSPYKWLALAALKWVRQYVSAGQIMEGLSKA